MTKWYALVSVFAPRLFLIQVLGSLSSITANWYVAFFPLPQPLLTVLPPLQVEFDTLKTLLQKEDGALRKLAEDGPKEDMDELFQAAGLPIASPS